MTQWSKFDKNFISLLYLFYSLTMVWPFSSNILALNTTSIITCVVDSVLFERMLLSQISQRMLDTTLILIDSYPPIVLIDWHLWEIIRCCWFRPTVKINPSSFLPSLCCSSSLPNSLSLCLTLHASCLIMFYLSWFRINTRWLQCMIIIDLNKLSRTTSLFHLGIAHNIWNGEKRRRLSESELNVPTHMPRKE